MSRNDYEEEQQWLLSQQGGYPPTPSDPLGMYPKEADPHGISQHTPGAKLDAGKNRVGLVLGDFSNALWAVSEIGTFGANKYTAHGWLSVPNGVERYTDALERHLLKENIDGPVDPESNMLHAAHAAWNALARLELIIRSTPRE